MKIDKLVSFENIDWKY